VTRLLFPSRALHADACECRASGIAESPILRTVTTSAQEAFAALPGAEIVSKGGADLEHGIESVESLLVSIGAARLSRLGLQLPRGIPHPEHRLYELLAAEDSDSAHSRYNALVRRLVSFERAAECAS